MLSHDFTSWISDSIYIDSLYAVFKVHFVSVSKLLQYMAAPSLPDTVEMRGFEPLTPCLQGRCSPN